MNEIRRALLLAPLGVAAAAGAGFYTVLRRMKQGRFDPHDLTNPLIGKAVPAFDLPALPGHQGFSTADILAQKRPVLVNFFASWCVPCVIEHPELMVLSHAGLPIWGVAYKDAADATTRFIGQRGNPYARIAADQPGRVAIDWGVYGVPESYLVDATGIIRWRNAGPITPDIAQDQLRPMLKALS